jgi:hypothetical protein
MVMNCRCLLRSCSFRSLILLPSLSNEYAQANISAGETVWIFERMGELDQIGRLALQLQSGCSLARAGSLSAFCPRSCRVDGILFIDSHFVYAHTNVLFSSCVRQLTTVRMAPSCVLQQSVPWAMACYAAWPHRNKASRR